MLTKFLFFVILMILLVFIPLPEISAIPKSLGNLTRPKFLTMSGKECIPGNVLKLKHRDFLDSIHRGTFYIKFYWPSCPECQVIKSTWINVATALKKKQNICVAEYNCEITRDFCAAQGVYKVPSFVWYQDGSQIKQFEGEPSFENLVVFAREINRCNSSHSFADSLIFTSKRIYFNLFGSLLFYSYLG